jgi:hypothetical protein
MNPSDVAAAYVVGIIREQHPNMHLRTCPGLRLDGTMHEDKVVGMAWCEHEEPEQFEFVTGVLPVIVDGA